MKNPAEIVIKTEVVKTYRGGLNGTPNCITEVVRKTYNSGKVIKERIIRNARTFVPIEIETLDV